MKKVLKPNISKNVILPLAIFTAFCGAVTGCSVDLDQFIPNLEIPRETPEEYVKIYPLPDQETIKKRLEKIYSSESEMFFLAQDWSGGIKRMPCKQNESIKVNVCFDASTIAHVAIDCAVEEINDMFDVVNPNYEFEVKYAPTKEDTKDVFNIEINSKEISDNSALAVTYAHPREYYKNEIDGSELFNSYIDVKSSILENDVARLKFVILHELCHCMGLGDAYNNPYATNETIMQSWGYSSAYVGLEVIDVATLAALYYDGATSPEALAQFVTDYKTVNKDYSQTYLLKEKCEKLISEKRWKNFLEDIDSEKLKQQISQLEDFKYYSPKLVQELFEAIDNKNFDTSFGKEIFQAGEIFDPNAKGTNTMHYLSNQWENDRVYDLFQTKMDSIGCWLHTFSVTESGQLVGRDGGLYVKIGEFVLSGSYEEKEDHVEFNPDGVYKITELSPIEYFAQFGIDYPAPGNYKSTENFRNAEKDK